MTGPSAILEDQIRAYVAGVVAEARPPGDDEPLVAHGFIPSVRLLDLVGFLEDTYRIRLRPVDLVPEKLSTIAGIAAVVRGRLTGSSPARRSSG